MKINNDYKKYMTYDEAIKCIAIQVVKKAIDDLQSTRYIKSEKHQKELEKFFCGDMCDFYLGFLPVKTTGEEIYKSIKNGGGIKWLF